jgi:Na+-transporting NADH:ubiquinone oxidoreductase subunit A|tara:strand:- start:3929 stop:5281 length:1353 start_codon:yes stop_codon:yes gene_type:complete
LAHINIRKGHNIRISGSPENEYFSRPKSKTVSIQPNNFRYVKPKLLVKVGDKVDIGSPIFFDKVQPDIKWASPGGGEIKEIILGDRRSVENIIIELHEEEKSVLHTPVKYQEISSLGKAKVTDQIMEANLWPMIRQRPFNKIADPNDTPMAIFVSGFNSAPLTVNLDFALRYKQSVFQAGLNVLNQLSNGNVHLTFEVDTNCETLTAARNVNLHTVNGPHPSGNVGIQIHHINPWKPNEVIWVINAQHVLTIGDLFLKGIYDPSIVATVAGPGVKNPAHIQTRTGASIETFLLDNLNSDDNRIISGDVLTGQETNLNGFLGYYDTTISVVPNSNEREFLGLLKPGNEQSRYSVTNAFISQNKSNFNFTTQQSGSLRPMVPINAWENMLPMDIYPNALYRSILAEDFEEMEGLGLLECDEEDFALCSFVCPSKIDVGSVIRHGLNLMKDDG